MFDSIAGSIAAALEALTGHKPEIEWQQAASPAIQAGDVRRRQLLQNLAGAVYVSSRSAASEVLSRQILRAAGLEENDAETRKSASFDLLNRAMDEFVVRLASRTGLDITRGQSQEITEDDPQIRWALLRVPFQGGTECEIAVGLDPVLADALSAPAKALPAPGIPKTLDLLLDVELPVSVSFGRAQIALKDVLKLTTGSILELERTISEPVEVIVNNCAIARAEVVVVEGNFGVRILQVISRQERLKTVS
ncbi:MAG: flagellar motor switch protein FliN [Bryobacterales bacterium]|nr:flagellar motor switch protein FliN [Bryobacterales bacterium]MBV9397160.1 flagellar motor switch protein FliN [Bryobacterales bacterium]